MRLIDADALLNDLKESVKAAREWKEEAQDEEIRVRAEQAHGTFVECVLRVKNEPTIEPEVRHGRWIDKGEYAVCTECHGRSATQYDGVQPIALMTQFCPYCGAKMSVGDNNG